MRLIFLSIIAVVAIIAGVVAMKLSAPAPVPVAAPVIQQVVTKDANVETTNVMFAKMDIPIGTTITDAMVDVQPYPSHLVLDSFVTVGGGEVVGKVTRSAIQAQQPFIKSQLANANDPGFLAGALPSGMRAITIATDVVSGVAGFVFPGDRVDVLLVHNVPAEIDETQKASAGHPGYTEVLVPNVRVLAVNVREVGPAGNANPAPSNITIEVSDENVQRIRLAEKVGTLSLSLRSIKDDNINIPNPTRMNDLSHIGTFGKVAGGDVGVMVVRGPGSGGGQITTTKTINGVAVGVDQLGSAGAASAGYGVTHVPE